MKRVEVTAPGVNEWVERPAPECGPNDVLLKPRATGICGSDGMYTMYGGIPPRQGETPLGHEPAAEVVEVGANVSGIEVGDHVVVDTMAWTDGLFGSGGAQGALSELVVVKDFEPNKQIKVIPKHIPWHVAALNEPMAVALHGVNRTTPKPGDKVVIFGAGPIGLGAVLGFRRAGAEHIIVVDIQAKRLEKALQIGADAVINSMEENLEERLVELHGNGASGFQRSVKSGTDIWYDAAGVSSVIDTATKMAKAGSVLGIVAVHKHKVEIDFQEVLTAELDIRWSMGYPTEIYEVTEDIVENWEKYALIVSDILPFDRALEALELAKTPGASDKVVVVMED